MKKIILLILLLINFAAIAQKVDALAELAIKKTIHTFFLSLEKQDSILYKSAVLLDGQIWRINNTSNPKKYDMRDFRTDITKLVSKNKLKEIPYRFDIKILNGIAMAWVPYEFYLNEQFTHCGIDVFSLIETQDGWKIVSLSYSIEKTGCEVLKKVN
ncbi:MAG: hypothetical protein ACK4S0_12410 [Sediminibacterium sp.]|nr:hypothetical protein [uncultured Sediminibacterium sp.]